MQQAYKIAAIDVGTNSVRLLVCEISSEGELIPLYKHIMTTRIGEGLSATGQLLGMAVLADSGRRHCVFRLHAARARAGCIVAVK